MTDYAKLLAEALKPFATDAPQLGGLHKDTGLHQLSGGIQRQLTAKVGAFRRAAEALAAYTAAKAHPAGGEGEWVMVPREPTDEMIAIGLGRLIKSDNNRAHVAQAYRAMLAAAPAAPPAIEAQWRGIESAPRDGTAVLLAFDPATTHHPIGIGSWSFMGFVPEEEVVREAAQASLPHGRITEFAGGRFWAVIPSDTMDRVWRARDALARLLEGGQI